MLSVRTRFWGKSLSGFHLLFQDGACVLDAIVGLEFYQGPGIGVAIGGITEETFVLIGEGTVFFD